MPYAKQPPANLPRRLQTDISTLLSADILTLRLQSKVRKGALWQIGRAGQHALGHIDHVTRIVVTVIVTSGAFDLWDEGKEAIGLA